LSKFIDCCQNLRVFDRGHLLHESVLPETLTIRAKSTSHADRSHNETATGHVLVQFNGNNALKLHIQWHNLTGKIPDYQRIFGNPESPLKPIFHFFLAKSGIFIAMPTPLPDS